MQNIIETFSKHNITLTPAGQWTMEHGKKKAKDAKRVDNLNWSSYPNDNMARHFLTKDIIVFDIDGEYSIIDNEANTIEIPSLELTLPLSLYSQTTKPGSYHIYYNANTSNIPNRITHILGTDCDVFSYGTIFEAHTFSEHYQLHDNPMLEAPEDLLKLIDSLDVPTTNKTGIITPTTNVQRFNLVRAFLEDELTSRKQWNAFYRSIIPAEYIQSGTKKIDLKDFPLSYDLFNKIAVKLTATAELDYNEHTVPALYKLLTQWGINPMSDMSQSLMHVNILPSLPQHASLTHFSLSDDDQTFQEHLDSQPATESPIFRTINNGKLFFIEVDKFSREPVAHGNSYLIDINTAQALHPERDIVNEEGRVVGWDSNLPIIYTMNSPYEPQYTIDTRHDRHQVNLYSPSEYIKQASPIDTVSANNILMKTLRSTVGPTYLDIVLAFYAQVVFGSESPSTVLWMAALETEKGGSGKSAVTIEIPSLILQQAASGIDVKTLTSGWGDAVSQVRLLSLEDMPNLSVKEWDSAYAVIKQQNTNAYRKLNMKGASVSTERIKVALTGSTNFRLKLSPSDRRMLCLEPAHFHGMTEPLTEVEQLELAKLLQTHDHSEVAQEFTDYLYHLYSAGFDKATQLALFKEAPPTEYRKLWVSSGATNTQNIIHSLSQPQDLHGIVKVDEAGEGELLQLYQFLVHTYNADTGKVALPWKWFEMFLPFVMAERHAESTFSKSSIGKMLHVDFNNCGAKYVPKWKKHLPSYMPPDWATWPSDGYVFALSDEAFEGYKSLISNMLGEVQDIKYPEEV